MARLLLQQAHANIHGYRLLPPPSCYLLVSLMALLFFLFCHAPLLAQPLSAYRNGHILPLSTGKAFYPAFQDQRGYLWGQDEQGRVVRYDGYELETFQAAPFDTVGLECNGQSYITEDSHGNIWVATGSCGLDRYDPKTGKVERLHDAFHEAREVPAQFYHGVFEDSRQDIWIRAQRQLYKYTPTTREFTKVNGYWHLTGILEDHEGNIWALDPFIKRKFYKVSYAEGDTLEEVDFPYIGDPRKVYQFPVAPTIANQNGEQFFIPFGGHLYHFDVAARKARPITAGLQDGERVYTVYNDGLTLVGTNRDRILEYDARTDKLKPFLDMPKLADQEDPVQQLFRTKDGLLWIVTDRRIFRVLPRRLPFRKVPFPDDIWPLTYAGISEPIVSFDGTVYFHTQSGLQPVLEQEKEPIGIVLKDDDFVVPPMREGGWEPSVDYVKARSGFKFVASPDRQQLWLAIYQYPFEIKWYGYDKSGERVYEYACRGWNTCFNDHLTDMDMAQDGRIWLAGWAGVSCFDPEEKAFHNLRVKDGLPERNAISILCSSDGSIWVGFNTAGLVRYDPESDCFDYYRHDEEVVGSLSSDYLVQDLLEDQSGNIWISTNNGLNRFNPATNTFELYHEAEGLPSAQIGMLKEDLDGGLWISAGHNLSYYDRHQNTFCNYGKGDGFLGVNDASSPPLRDQTGRLFFPVEDGTIYFHPDSVTDARMPKLRLRDFQLANVPVKPRDSTGVLSKPIGFTEQITLQPWQNVFTIRYAALEYLAPQNIKYAFQLEGFDPDWRMVGNAREATYTNLAPGDYRFKVKCWNRHGLEGEPIFLNITVLPPWYRTGWAYLLWGLLLLALLYALYKFQLNRRLAQAKVEQEREINILRSRLYTNITHEFRTPLSIILGMVNQINRDPQGWLGEGLSKIRQYSFQLLRLVNQLLDLSKLEADKLPVNMVQQDIVPFLKYLVESFGSYAQAEGVDLQLDVQPDELVMDYDAEKATTIVSNLLSNAIKFTPEGGRVEVRVSATEEALQLQVADTGRGIPKAELRHIFDRFYQVDDSSTRQGEGTGIGLALTKELVKLLGGSIEVQSEVGKGTVFSVSLPISREAEVAAVSSKPTDEAALFTPGAEGLANAAKASASAAAEEKPLLLIVEDNRDVIDYLALFLSDEYQIQTAGNGAIGIEKAQELVPDLIVSDVMMPEKDGFQLCDNLKNDVRTSHIPIVLLTAKSDVSSRIAGLKRGADAYLPKPFDEQELRVQLQNLLQQRRLLQERYREGWSITEDSPPDIQIEHAFLKQLREVVEAHIDQDIRIPWLAQQVHLGRTQLSRKTNALIGKTPTAFVREIRIEHSKRLLRQTDKLVSEVAYAVGYNDPAFFSRVFGDEVGVPPKEWREKWGDAT